MIIKALILNSLFLVSALFSQENNATQEEHYIDGLHKKATFQVKKWSSYADDTLVDMADYIDNKEANISEPTQSVAEENKNAVDSFFLNDKYLDETDQSYVSIRPDTQSSSKEDNEFNLKISAHLALSKSKKRFRLFINDLDQDNVKHTGADNTKDQENAPEIGMNYFAPDSYGIKSKYSVGVKGVYPFARARYSTEFHAGEWIIEPIQTLKYSTKDDFEEETQLFFDTKVTNLSLLRLYVDRGTESRIPGMKYDGSISIFWTPSKDTGLSLSQYFNASTKFQHTQDENVDPIIYEDYSGIYNYGTSVSIRQNIWRKWLFYELQPGINFHKTYDYEANYTIRAFLDIFIGNI